MRIPYRCVLKNKKKKGNDPKKKERMGEKLDTEQVVGTIILSMHGITDRNEILGRVRIHESISILIERLLASIFDRENLRRILTHSI